MVLVLVDHDRGRWVDANDEALTWGRGLSASLRTELHAVVIGVADDSIGERLTAGGIDVVHLARHPILTDFGPEAAGETLAQLVSAVAPEAVVSVGTDRGNEVMAQAAARLDLPFVANAVSVEPATEPWSLTRVQWGGSLLEDVTVQAPTKLVSFARHAAPADAPEAPGAGRVAAFSPELDQMLARTIVKDRTVQDSGLTLSSAPVVVSGGRGVGSADGFAILEELADLLGGRVGCSRAVTNLGWRNHADQVGQTGTRIAPEIYIAAGISGAIQHWVGAMASKRILAVNTDAEANMVAKADHAVIADLHEVIPAISAEIRRRRSARASVAGD